MTTLTTPQQIWNTMPGWGIVADLTPPELIASRRLAVLRKLLIACLSVLLVLLAVGYGYVRLQAHSAASGLADANLRTVQLRNEQNRYAPVTRVQNAIDGVETVTSKLMSSDIDMAQLLTALRQPLPASMSVSSVTLTISQAGAAAASSSGGNSLNTSGHQGIGKVQLEGDAQSVADLAGYVVSLQQVPGVVDVVPGSDTVSGGSVTWSLTCSVTDQLISHYFDKGKVATK